MKSSNYCKQSGYNLQFQNCFFIHSREEQSLCCAFYSNEPQFLLIFLNIKYVFYSIILLFAVLEKFKGAICSFLIIFHMIISRAVHR